MINISDNLQKQIIDSRIDIEALNEYIRQEENNENNVIVSENGQIYSIEKNESLFTKVIDWIKKIFVILGLIDEKEEKSPVGIINIRNNCYMNAGLQILSRCYPLVKILVDSNFYTQDKLIKILVESLATLLFRKDKFYNPSEFIETFCKRNKEFVAGEPNCSQDFIRTILRNINDIFKKNTYFESIPSNPIEYDAFKNFKFKTKIFPESKPYSIFSGILRIHLYGKCQNCNKEVNDYSFSSFVDQQIYLNSCHSKCTFSEVLRKNFGLENKAIMKCSECKKNINLKLSSKFVKIPQIFIFTLERYLVRNKVIIEPDEFIDISNLVDKSYSIPKEDCIYELFAKNIRQGEDLSFGHEICQIKQNNKWYTIDDGGSYPKQKEFNDYTYGLFYKRKNPKNSILLIVD